MTIKFKIRNSEHFEGYHVFIPVGDAGGVLVVPGDVEGVVVPS